MGLIKNNWYIKGETGGTYSLIEAKVFPGGGAIPHIQTREHEGFT